MKSVDLKYIIAGLFSEQCAESESVAFEILENVLGETSFECVPKPVTAFEVNGVLVFLSHTGLPMPKYLFLADVKAGTLVLQEVSE